MIWGKDFLDRRRGRVFQREETAWAKTLEKERV